MYISVDSYKPLILVHALEHKTVISYMIVLTRLILIAAHTRTLHMSYTRLVRVRYVVWVCSIMHTKCVLKITNISC